MGAESHREIDDNGFLLVKDTPVSSFGIFEYSAAQVGITEGDPDRIVKVFRPEAEISNPEAIASFQVVPFIDEHDLLSGFEDDTDVMSPEEKGVDGVMYNVHYAAPWLRADVKAFTRRMQRAINSGKVELSLGYGCDFILQSGTFQGEAYEVMQVNMRGNHLALVEAARVEGAKVLDSKVAFDCLSFYTSTPTGENTMAKKANPRRVSRKVGDASAVERLKSLLPALEQFLNEEASEPAHQEGAVAEAGGEQAEQSAPPATEGGEDSLGGEGPSLEQVIAEVEAILAELKGGESAEQSSIGQDEEEGVNRAEDGDEEKEPESKAEDEEPVGGLLEAGGQKLNAEDGEGKDCEGNGKASKGPASGANPSGHVGDAAIRRSVYQDIDRKNKLYDRVSPIIGAFDCALMTSEDLAAYAVKKLKINAPKGHAATALDSYLAGVERTNAAKVQAAKVGDGAFGDFDPIDKYLQGGK